MSDDEHHGDDGKSEAQRKMEENQKSRKERAAEELAEYEEMRKEQREKEAEEIRQLRQRRETRKKEREEEEKRLAGQRAEEMEKRRAEEEERQRKKKEEEVKKREAREAKQKEHEEKTKKSGPNFTINKKAADGSPEEGGENEKVPTKSKEQLDAERKAELEKRYHKVTTQGLNADQLRDKAKELHQMIYHLESEKYDLSKRFEQQNYDMQELAERARQMSKGGGKNKANVAQTPDPLAAKFSGIPPKVVMYSQYERVKDHRTFVERTGLYAGPLYADEFTRIEPTTKVVMTEQGARVIEEGGPTENGH